MDGGAMVSPTFHFFFSLGLPFSFSFLLILFFSFRKGRTKRRVFQKSTFGGALLGKASQYKPD
jgi:hypothetical protein